MDNNRLQYLHQKYISDQMSPEELYEWKAALGNPEADQSVQQLMDGHWKTMSVDKKQEANTERFEEMYKEVIAHQKNTRPVRRLWPRIAVAAAVTVIVFGTGLFYYYNQSAKTGQITVYANDVAPGKQGATLTLANGQRILIKDALAGNIADQSGVKISKGADGQIIYEVTDVKSGALEYNTLSTTRGEHTQVRLPDGSTVFLNAASSLKYPTSFARSETRRVSLTGEGYFEISKDKAHPFIVSTDKQEVQVLGTHFNINAYPDESAVATTLLEGSVKISPLRGVAKNEAKRPQTEIILKPGQQAVNNGSGIKVAKANVDNITDWKDGDFNLDGLDFRLAMRKIGRWYDVEVIYESGVPDGIETGGWISRNNKLSDVLKLIEKSGFVHFRVEGKKLYVSK